VGLGDIPPELGPAGEILLTPGSFPSHKWVKIIENYAYNETLRVVLVKPSYFSANTRGPSPTSPMQILGFGANLTHAWRVLVARILLPAPDTQGWNSHQNRGFAWSWLETDPEWKMMASAGSLIFR
jgi:hypothetical protein